ncbi:MAG: hypothetical protein OXJ52_02740 [Oligoflexia bacterium]|nr:hypothetical protein [Oligoflexia bacterium]
MKFSPHLFRLPPENGTPAQAGIQSEPAIFKPKEFNCVYNALKAFIYNSLGVKLRFAFANLYN